MKLTPRQEQLYAALSGLDEQYVDEALNSGKHTALPILYRAAAIAATIVVIISLSLGLQAIRNYNPYFTLITDSPFTLNVYASNGSSTSVWDALFSSFSPDYKPEPMFGGHPTFRFSVTHKDWRPDDGNIAYKYDLTISYWDVVINEHTWNDEHIAYFVSNGNAQNGSVSQFSILGWFDEPTDITITLTDRETGQIVQEQIVHIEYLEDSKKYKTTVTDFYFDGGYNNKN